MEELKVVYLPPEELTPYEKNTRKHLPKDVAQIKESILQDGFNDPIGIWGEDNIIVEGHGRQIAALELHLEKVPCIRLDHLTDEQRRDYAIRHNRTAELSEWDVDTLMQEVAQLEIEGHDFSGLEFDFGGEIIEHDNPYTGKVNIPQYEPSGDEPPLAVLVDKEKANELIREIDESDLPDDEKEFLRLAAYRHLSFNYKRVADYYAGASKEMQKLMEKSALVIIDYEDAIANGFTRLNNSVKEMFEDVEG